MKWTGFLLGGLAGAAAAVYVARRRPGMFAWASAAAGEAWTGMKGRAVNAALGRRHGSEAVDAGPKHSHASGEGSGKAWGQIESLLNQDPGARREAEQIISEAAKH